MTLVTRAGPDSSSLTDTIRARVRAVDSSIPVLLTPAANVFDTLLAPARFRTRLFGAFAAARANHHMAIAHT